MKRDKFSILKNNETLGERSIQRTDLKKTVNKNPEIRPENRDLDYDL